MKDKERSFLVSRPGPHRGQVQNVRGNGDASRGKSVESGQFGGNNTESTSGFGERFLKNVGPPQQLYISGRLGEIVPETDLQAMWKPSTGDLKDIIPIRPGLVEHLNWWRSAENL